MNRFLWLIFVIGCATPSQVSTPLVFVREPDCPTVLETYLQAGCQLVATIPPNDSCSNCSQEFVFACPQEAVDRVEHVLEPPEGVISWDSWGSCDRYEVWRVRP